MTTKGRRFLTFAIPAVLVYFLMWLSVVPVPFVSSATAEAILPVVSIICWPLRSYDLAASLLLSWEGGGADGTIMDPR